MTTLLGAYVRHKPDEARKRILAELRKTDGNVVRAAKSLGVEHRTLRRWIVDLGLQPKLDAIRGV